MSGVNFWPTTLQYLPDFNINTLFVVWCEGGNSSYDLDALTSDEAAQGTFVVHKEILAAPSQKGHRPLWIHLLAVQDEKGKKHLVMNNRYDFPIPVASICPPYRQAYKVGDFLVDEALETFDELKDGQENPAVAKNFVSLRCSRPDSAVIIDLENTPENLAVVQAFAAKDPANWINGPREKEWQIV